MPQTSCLDCLRDDLTIRRSWGWWWWWCGDIRDPNLSTGKDLATGRIYTTTNSGTTRLLTATWAAMSRAVWCTSCIPRPTIHSGGLHPTPCHGSINVPHRVVLATATREEVGRKNVLKLAQSRSRKGMIFFSRKENDPVALYTHACHVSMQHER